MGFIIPESTFWLKTKQTIIQRPLEDVKIAIADDNTTTSDDKNVICISEDNSLGASKEGPWKEFFKPKHSKYVMLGVTLAVSYQLTGMPHRLEYFQLIA